jgi:tetratricopeptide (TPR) repeat protein
MKSSQSHYDILGVAVDCDFKELKKAYFKRAKECHPDLFSNSKEKENEFKQLVYSFDILSDPRKRAEYNYSIGRDVEEYRYIDAGYSIMDSPADDTLEEIIVGNSIPETATMNTLFLDLKKTELFIIFREGKNCYYKRNLGRAMSLFREAVDATPHNILYRFFLARTCVAAGRYREALKHYKTAIQIGKTRIPAQRLERIHAESAAVRKKKSPWWYGITAIFAKEQPRNLFAETEAGMIEEANRAIARMFRDQKNKKKRLL